MKKEQKINIMKTQIKSKTGEILKELENDNLRGANLYGADLRYANLRGSDLRDANLRGADLFGADLRGADLRYANLSEANLYGADLSEANLYGADLRGANLYGADLRYANLRGSDLRDANLRGADLRGADLRGALTPIFCRWGQAVTSKNIRIGCETKTAEEWEQWLDSDEEFSTKRGTPEFKRIEAVIRACITYQEVINQTS